MKILVCSCDKDDDTFDAFHHCMEKYWKNHPEIIYATETIQNPYYKTISKNYPLEMWTKRIRETLQEIDDDKIILMIDDLFIRKNVDTKRIKYVESVLKGNIAMFNFEKQFDNTDEECEYIGFKKRKNGSLYQVSIMCGMWQKDKLMKVLETDSDPWTVEYTQDNKGFDYYINSDNFIINWGYENWKPAGITKGKWNREVIPFFEKEGIHIDYEKRGFVD